MTEPLNAGSLAIHLARMRGDIYETPAASEKRAAETICVNPQTHIDALVEAGVLEKGYGQTEPNRVLPGGTTVQTTGPFYRVVQPHQHGYRACYVSPALGAEQKGDRFAPARSSLVVSAWCECGDSRSLIPGAGSVDTDERRCGRWRW